MRASTTRKAVVELTTLIEGWLETVAYPGEFPHLPPDIAGMMAQQAKRHWLMMACWGMVMND